MEPALFETRGPLQVMVWSAFAGLGVDAVVTTRAGGVSTGPYHSLNLGLHVGDDDRAVVENRRRAARALGLTLDELVFCDQTHGARVAVVGTEDRGRGARRLDDALAATDAIVTSTPGVGLVVMAADCTPIVLYDPEAQVLGCVHAGWRGTTANVAEAALDAMVALGASPSRVVAGVGPAVAAAGYQVGPEVAEAVEAALPQPDGCLSPDDEGRWRLDLWAANRQLLVAAGVPAAHIHTSPWPTGGDLFFSDRAVRPCGRLAVIAALRS